MRRCMLIPLPDDDMTHQEAHMQCVVIVAAGKSSLAQQLASRFNMPNVLQTDMFYEVCLLIGDLISSCTAVA